MGIVSYLDKPAIVYWISHDGSRRKNTVLYRGEKNTFWMNTILGHRFEIVDEETGGILYNLTAEYNSFHALGDAGSYLPKW